MPQERRLAAILVADVVGFSRLVGADETGTLARLEALRHEITDPLIASHGGRLFKQTGDGFLVEFGSAVQAVICARAIQEKADGGPLRLRIGIHLGDVVVQGDDLLGDGVNIAARLEGVAPPGGIALSRQVHDQVRDRIAAPFEDRGEVPLKNIARPVHVFALGSGKAPEDMEPAALALPDKPSIAVLPFQNMSGDPEQEYFADGIVEDIITALSRFKSLFVIARNSSFVYKGRAIDIKQVGRELGVRYVLEGSVRKSGGRVRITGQLIEAATGAHLWADRFDSALEDIFDLQDRVAASVAGTVGTRLEEVEIEHARRRPPNSLDAYDCFLRGQAVFRLRTRQALDEAHLMFERAIELDPDFSTPYGLAARCYSTQRLHGWIDDVDRATSDVRRYAKAVSRAGQDDALAQSWLAFALMWVCADHVGGETFIDRALAINPNLAVAWQVKGWISQQLGDHERSLEEFGRATRLSPIGPDFHLVQGYGALSLFLLERDATALRQATHALNHLPSWPVGPLVCAALHGLAGNRPEARSCIARLGDLMPGLTLSTMSDLFIFRQHKDLERLRSGLRLAGLPE